MRGPAARIGDFTDHPGVIAGPGALQVLIGGAPAARSGDPHTCALAPTAGPHPPNTIAGGSTTVRIGGFPAARIQDPTVCGALIITGLPSVVIGG
jgi:uncharacterized Zn-binding protein involved in type VI secretion